MKLQRSPMSIRGQHGCFTCHAMYSLCKTTALIQYSFSIVSAIRSDCLLTLGRSRSQYKFEFANTRHCIFKLDILIVSLQSVPDSTVFPPLLDKVLPAMFHSAMFHSALSLSPAALEHCFAVFCEMVHLA